VTTGWAIFLGMVAAIFVGVLLFPEEIDAIGDALIELTTSEETRLSQLEPATQAAVRLLLQTLNNQGMVIHVGQTLRSPAAEKAVIAAGKSAVKTHSWHELGRAVDLYPINPDTGAPDLNGARVDLFLKMQRQAETLGFRQIAFTPDDTRHFITNAQGKQIWDGGHMEYRAPYGTIAEAVAAEGAAYGIA
jgi:hypothetical protein